MRIGILTTQCPFVRGGAEMHAASLERELRNRGYEVEIISMPFKWYPPGAILDHMAAARSMDVSEFNGVKIDLAIALKFPAYYMPHPNKRYWILHQHRQAYDLWDSGSSDLFDDGMGQLIRAAVTAGDNAELASSRYLFANSRNVADRLRRYNGLTAEPLYHPPPLAHLLEPGPPGSYFLYPSRINSAKRQALVLRALALAPRSLNLVFSGLPDNRTYGDELQALADTLGVGDRIRWEGFVSDEKLISLYKNARAVVFTPIDEDLGYVALEAMASGKALITTFDSGEPATLVRHDISGILTEPTPASIGAALESLSDAKELAERMGIAAYRQYQEMNISWDSVVEKLLADACSSVPSYRSGSYTSLSLNQQDDGGFPIIDKLMAEFDFGDHMDENREYYEVHWQRYSTTLSVLRQQQSSAARILEIGSSNPYVFSVLLHKYYPNARLSVVQADSCGVVSNHTVVSKSQQENINIEIHCLNIETHPLPFAEEEFDLIIMMEVIEHLAIDPSFCLMEAWRKLKPGGMLLVTTPNIISFQGIQSALNGSTPYSFGQFVPWNGIYGRHNREYTPHEIAALGEYAGFNSELLQTFDVYELPEQPCSNLLRFMQSEKHSTSLRGQNIFWIGRKRGAAFPVDRKLPESLYPCPPDIFDFRLELEIAEDDHSILRLENTGRQKWFSKGKGRVVLGADRVHQSGFVDKEFIEIPLQHDLSPGENLKISIRHPRPTSFEGFWFEFQPILKGAGSFLGAGRGSLASIFAKQIIIISET